MDTSDTLQSPTCLCCRRRARAGAAPSPPQSAGGRRAAGTPRRRAAAARRCPGAAPLPEPESHPVNRDGHTTSCFRSAHLLTQKVSWIHIILQAMLVGVGIKHQCHQCLWFVFSVGISHKEPERPNRNRCSGPLVPLLQTAALPAGCRRVPRQSRRERSPPLRRKCGWTAATTPS